jgi:hypothetical protein
MFNKQTFIWVKQGLTWFLLGVLGIVALLVLCPLWIPAIVGFVMMAEYRDYKESKRK